MKRLLPHTIDARQARIQWNDYKANLLSKSNLDEKRDVQPFFYLRYDLAAMLSYYFPSIKTVDVVAHEFIIYGDFVADMIVGDTKEARYLLIEFEDGSPNSVFNKTPKTAPDWAKRYEGAFSQLVDWMWKLDDMRSTGDFQRVFGTRDASFQGLIVAGKEMNLATQEQARLRWRIEKTKVNSTSIEFVSFDGLADDVNFWLTKYLGV